MKLFNKTMLSLKYINLHVLTLRLLPKAIFAPYSRLCANKIKPASEEAALMVSKGGTDGGSKIILTRALASGKVRLSLIPDEWFLFFHSKTGVTGPYLFGAVLANYLISKEIFVLEHEYYLGLSWFVISVCVVKLLGSSMASWLDQQVDKYQADFENARKDEINSFEETIKLAKEAQWRAEGQKALIEAKKENIDMQLEAAYRERCMHVYRAVKGRMDYHAQQYQTETRIHQKWMVEWILANVKKSITPDFEKQALDAAIRELTAVAARTK